MRDSLLRLPQEQKTVEVSFLTRLRKRLLSADFDVFTLLAALVLCAIGVLMVYSASISASFLATDDASTSYFFDRHMRNFVIGLVVMFLLSAIDYRVWQRYSLWIMIGTIGSLVMVLQFGDERLAASRSLIQGSVQPGEAAKMAVVVYMAAWLASRQKHLKNISYGLIPFSILMGLTCILLVLQPDLSTAATVMATALTMFFLAGADWFQLGGIASGAGISGYLMITQLDYAQSRINDHLAAIQDLTQANDHVQASVEAFLNGQLFGVGLGEGTQKFGRLPFPHTDSIFAVIGEELGLMGAFIVVGLFMFLVYRGFVVAKNATDLYGALLASGVVLSIAYDAMLNIAVMTALVPPTGVPLPFISFGGSSLVTAMAGIGLVLSVSRQSLKEDAPAKERANHLPFDLRHNTTAPQKEETDQANSSAASDVASESTTTEKQSQEQTHDGHPQTDIGERRRHRRGHISRVSRRERDS